GCAVRPGMRPPPRWCCRSSRRRLARGRSPTRGSRGFRRRPARPDAPHRRSGGLLPVGVFQQALHELQLVPHPGHRAVQIVEVALQHFDAPPQLARVAAPPAPPPPPPLALSFPAPPPPPPPPGTHADRGGGNPQRDRQPK